MPPLAATTSSDLATGGGAKDLAIWPDTRLVKQPLGDVDGHILVYCQIKKPGKSSHRRQELENFHARLKASMRFLNGFPSALAMPEGALP
jgi:hypothetical protein